METLPLKRFAQYARRNLIEQVATKLELVLAADSAARREYPNAIKELNKAIATTSTEQVIEKVAYTWFNRFCALRFMDVNRYNRINILSPLPGAFQPEILAEAKMGHIDETMVPEKNQQQIFALLNESVPSSDPQAEAYRLLIVAACNYYNRSMPYLFERITDYTELLMPNDLLSSNSILAYTREAMPPEVCKDVEVIGWLYQFYISEKKDDVFLGLKKNKKITPENIPAATQLFTPHWIVRYLVENSLGRLWMLNHPNSKLVDKMEYYIEPEVVASGEGLVDRVKKGEINNDKKLQGFDSLAEGNGLSRSGLQGDETIPQRGDVCANESTQESSGISSIKNSGRTGKEIDSRIQELSFDSKGIVGGSGNPTDNSKSSKLFDSRTISSNYSNSSGNQQNATGIDGKTNPSPLITSHLEISSPEEIRICDPACGSGHILTYAFDLLYAIYEEEGYDPIDIPTKILTYNLYGIEIDERAAELAAFALTMKARSKQRRFFRKPVQPNICLLKNIQFEDGELDGVESGASPSGKWDVKSGVWGVESEVWGKVVHDLNLFAEADNFGSLLQPQLTAEAIKAIRETIDLKLEQNSTIFEQYTLLKVKRALEQADYLSSKYHVVVANPPYMGSKGMNGRLGAWAKDHYPNSKSDLFAMFIERNLELVVQRGSVGMITMQSWMFLSSYEKLRSEILDKNTILSMAHLGARGFDSIGGEVVQTTAFVLENSFNPNYMGAFLRLIDGKSETEKSEMFKSAIKVHK